ncbi:MAG: TRAP transporter substrate-binding protein [Hyphomicrobiales bacterium]|nr:TRAP transporter substrate-binding protein [Hyphomicrobiales bacterium]
MRALLRTFAATVFAGLVGATSAAAETTLRLGHVLPANEIQAEAAQLFADRVAELSDGAVKIQVFGGSALGNDRDMVEGLNIGTVDLWVGGAGVLTAASQTAAIFTVPFMFDELAQFQKVYDGEIGATISKRIAAESGHRILAYWMRGPRWLTTKSRVDTPADLKGLKIRVPDSPVFVRSWQQLGAAPSPMAFGEVFTALQQGVIDGQENPLSLIYTARFSEVIDYLVKTQHVLEPIVMVMSARRLKALDPKVQKVLLDASNGKAKSFVADRVTAGEEAFIKKLVDQGMTLVEVDKSLFQKRLEGFVEAEFPKIKDVHGMIRSAR